MLSGCLIQSLGQPWPIPNSGKQTHACGSSNLRWKGVLSTLPKVGDLVFPPPTLEVPSRNKEEICQSSSRCPELPEGRWTKVHSDDLEAVPGFVHHTPGASKSLDVPEGSLQTSGSTPTDHSLTFYLFPRRSDSGCRQGGVAEKRTVVGHLRRGGQTGLQSSSYRPAVSPHALPQNSLHAQRRRSRLRHGRQRHQVLDADGRQEAFSSACQELLLQKGRSSYRLEELQRFAGQYRAVLLLDLRLKLGRRARLEGVPNVGLQVRNL